MDDKGKVVETVRLKNEPCDLIGFVDRLSENSKIAILLPLPPPDPHSRQ